MATCIAKRNRLVEDNMGLVGFVIKRMKNHLSCCRAEIDEAVSEGYLALIKAAEGWDPNYGVKFSTYAVKCLMTHLADCFNRKKYRNFGLSYDHHSSRYTQCGEAGEMEPKAKPRDLDLPLDVDTLLSRVQQQSHRDLVVRRYMHNEPVADIALEQGVCTQAIRDRTDKALAQMRKSVAEEPPKREADHRAFALKVLQLFREHGSCAKVAHLLDVNPRTAWNVVHGFTHNKYTGLPKHPRKVRYQEKVTS